MRIVVQIQNLHVFCFKVSFCKFVVNKAQAKTQAKTRNSKPEPHIRQLLSYISVIRRLTVKVEAWCIKLVWTNTWCNFWPLMFYLQCTWDIFLKIQNYFWIFNCLKCILSGFYYSWFYWKERKSTENRFTGHRPYTHMFFFLYSNINQFNYNGNNLQKTSLMLIFNNSSTFYSMF